MNDLVAAIESIADTSSIPSVTNQITIHRLDPEAFADTTMLYCCCAVPPPAAN